MPDHNNPIQLPGATPLLYTLGAGVGAMLLLNLYNGFDAFLLSETDVITWGTLLIVFVSSALVRGPVHRAGWFGLSGVSVLVAGLLIGGGAGLWLWGVGLLAQVFVTLLNQQKLNQLTVAWMLTFAALAAVPLLLLALLRAVTGLPWALTEGGPLWSAILVSVVAWGGVHLLAGLWIARYTPHNPPLWSVGGRMQAWEELALLLLVVPLVLAGQVLPSAAFACLVLCLLVLVLRGRVQSTPPKPPEISPEDDLRLLGTLTQTLNSHLYLEDLLDAITDIVQQVLPTHSFFIAFYNPDTPNILKYVLLMNDTRQDSTGYKPLRQGSLEAQTIQNGEPILLPRATSFTTNLHGQMPPGTMAALCCPIFNGERFIGVMGWMDDARDQFTPVEVRQAELIARQAGGAIDNARLFTSRTSIIRNLSRVNNSTQSLLFNLDSQDAIHTICQTAQEITQADYVAVFLLDRQTDQLELAYDINLSDVYKQAVQPYRYDADNHVPRIIRDVSLTDDPSMQRLCRVGGFRAMAETFMMSGNSVAGILVVYHQVVYDYPVIEMDLLQMLANQITVALENADLLRALEMYASEMAQLVHLSRTSLTSLLPAEVAANAIRTIRQMFHTTSAQILLVEPIINGSDIITVLGKSPGTLHTPHRQSLNIYPELAALREGTGATRQALHLDDPSISRGLRHLLTRNNEQTMMVVPLSNQTDTFGAVLLGNKQKRHFSEREWQFAETAANLTASQVQNAQMYNATREALVRRLEQLSYIELLVQQISKSVDIDSTIDGIIEATVRVTQPDTVILAQRTHDEQYHIIRQHNQGEGAGRTAEDVAEAPPAVAAVFKTGEAILSPAYGLDFNAGDTPLLGQYPSILAVPLMRDNRVIGVLSVQSAARDAFTEEQLNFLQNLADHMVLSIANARLMQQRRAQVENLRKLRQLSMRVTGLTDRSQVAIKIMHAATDILGGEGEAVYHYDATTHHIYPLAETTQSQNNLKPLTPELAAEVMQSGSVTVHTADDATHTRVIIPLIRGETIQDMVILHFDGAYTPSKADLEAVDLLMSQATSHMENAVLYEQIQSNSNRMRAILESTHDGIILLDRRDSIIDYNTAAENMLGVSLAAYAQQPFAQLPLTYEETQRENVPRAMMENTEANLAQQLPRFEMALQHDNGEKIYLERTHLPVQDTQQRVIGRLLVFRDITEEKELAKYRDEIIYMLVHDLRSPLGSVISGLNFAEFLSEQPDAAEELTTVLQLAKRGGNRLMNLINTLLDVERGQMTMIKDDWQIDKLVDEAFNDIAQLALEVDIEVKKYIEPNLPILHIDGEKIQRVLTNLLDNALDYSQSQIFVQVATNQDNSQVVIQVSDDGPGIPPEKRSMIFGKFSQADGQEQRRGKHSGLGLTYCRRAVEAHGGQIWVVGEETSQPCPLPGACFKFTLPISSMPAASTEQLQEQASS